MNLRQCPLEAVPCDSFAEPDMPNCLTVVFKDTGSCQGSGFVHLNRQMFISSRDAQPSAFVIYLVWLSSYQERDLGHCLPISTNLYYLPVWVTNKMDRKTICMKENWLVYYLTGYVRHIQNQMVFMIQCPETFLNLNIQPSFFH